jgi:hypothetical protein
MAHISGQGNIVLGAVTVASVTPSGSHMTVAQALLPSIRYLVDTLPTSTWAVSLLAGQAAECLLRAAISRGSLQDPVRSTSQQHDISALWDRAVVDGLAVPEARPQWFDTLANLHKKYHLRYASDLHGISLPNATALALGLTDLAASVETYLAK